MTVHKCLNGKAPELISSMLQLNSNARFSETNILSTRLFYPNTNFGKRAFVYYAPKMWNCVPQDIRIESDLPIFKRKLKTYLFNTSYDSIMQLYNRYRT